MVDRDVSVNTNSVGGEQHGWSNTALDGERMHHISYGTFIRLVVDGVARPGKLLHTLWGVRDR